MKDKKERLKEEIIKLHNEYKKDNKISYSGSQESELRFIEIEHDRGHFFSDIMELIDEIIK